MPPSRKRAVGAAAPAGLSAYETKRQRSIEGNAEKLRELGLQPLLPTSKRANRAGSADAAASSAGEGALVLPPGGRLSAQAVWGRPTASNPAPLSRAERVVQEDDIVCYVCGDGDDEEGNDLLICDNIDRHISGCVQGCHLRCHQPPLRSVQVTPYCCRHLPKSEAALERPIAEAQVIVRDSTAMVGEVVQLHGGYNARPLLCKACPCGQRVTPRKLWEHNRTRYGRLRVDENGPTGMAGGVPAQSINTANVRVQGKAITKRGAVAHRQSFERNGQKPVGMGGIDFTCQTETKSISCIVRSVFDHVQIGCNVHQ